MANTGRVYTLIVKGDPKEAEKVLLTENPTIVDVLPLTLEEIFIYELGGVDYEVKDILSLTKQFSKKKYDTFLAFVGIVQLLSDRFASGRTVV